MRRISRLKNTPREIDSSELARVSGVATLSVGNLLLSIAVTDVAASNIDTALQLGPR